MPLSNPSERAVFLDRDGTLIVEREYLADPDGVQFVPRAFEALRMLRDGGYRLVVVTNQSGIARGLYSLQDYRRVEARINEALAEQGIVLDGVYFCPHHPDYDGPCECRKPGLGMYREAERNLGIDLAASAYVGDRLKDVEPARAVGGRAILVKTGYGTGHMAAAEADVEIAEDLYDAARLILEKDGATA